jgi:hypothetical protein
MSERTGRCLCGAVTFRLAAEPLVTRVCWCRDCQHLAGNGTVNMLVPAEALVVTGALSEHTKKAGSGNEVTRQFCPVVARISSPNHPAGPGSGSSASATWTSRRPSIRA